MVEKYDFHTYGSVGLMTAGLLAMTVGADAVTEARSSLLLAALGGIAAVVGGVWGFRVSELRNGYDERYLAIGLRGAAVALWAVYWSVAAWSQIESNADVTTPVLDPLTWLMLVPLSVFLVTVAYYDRVM